jgi:hypothetical protein
MDDKTLNLVRQIDGCRRREKARRKAGRARSGQPPLLS